MHAVILACICTFLLVLVLSGTVKWFSLDLVLFLREISIKFNRKEGKECIFKNILIHLKHNFMKS